jgi:glycosyltransferase involved in cell wall biosynthesis
MKICIINALCNHGGASINAFDIARGMTAKGHKVKFICSGTSERSFWQDGYQVIELSQKIRSPIFHYFNPALLFKLKKQLYKFQPDIINLHNINLQTFSLGSLLFSQKYPMVWTLHDVWPLCMTGWPNQAGCDGFLYNCRNCNTWPKTPVAINKLIKEFVFKVSKFCIACPSAWMASNLINSQLFLKSISRINYGIDNSLFYPERKTSADIKHDMPNGKKIILFCGGKRLAGEIPAWRKGWQYLVDALRILVRTSSNLHLLYVGESIKLPKDFPVGITFAEGVVREKMRKYFVHADICVLPTLGDNSPLTILEAMACKTPIIATNVGGIPESLISGETGLLCPPRNADSLAKSIEFFLKHPSEATGMAERGYQKLNKEFRFNKMIDLYETLYRETIAGGCN